MSHYCGYSHDRELLSLLLRRIAGHLGYDHENTSIHLKKGKSIKSAVFNGFQNVVIYRRENRYKTFKGMTCFFSVRVPFLKQCKKIRR